jgi:hypothetical protein
VDHDARSNEGAADADHQRPPGASDGTVEAAGKISEALEWVERARGRLYDFHQMLGRADLLAQDAAELLEEAGHAEVAEHVRTEVVGRNVLYGRWTFQIVEEFDEGYWHSFRTADRRVRDELLDGRKHVFESEMKDREITPGHPDHRRRPEEPA